MTGDAFRSLRDRLSAFEVSGDDSLLTDPRVPDEIAELRRLIGWPAFGALPDDSGIRRRLDAIVLLGTFIWLRARGLPEVDQLDAKLEATELLAAAYSFAPDSVPRKIARPIAALVRSTRGRDHADLHDHAVDVLGMAGPAGDLVGIDEAIWLLSFALRAAAGDAYQPYYLSDLGTAWLNRYRITRRHADLDNSLAAHQQALATPVAVAEDQAGRLASYSTALLARFARDGDERDLDRAVAAARSAARLAASAAAEQARSLAGRQPPARDQVTAVMLAQLASLERLSVTLLAAFDQRRHAADLDEAVEAATTAAALAPPGHPVHARYQAGLALALRICRAHAGDAADLHEAGAAAAGLRAVPQQSPSPDEHPAPPAQEPRKSAVVPFRRRPR
jgi:hypothetical protein